MTESDPVAQAEAIIEAESTMLHDIHDLIESQVISIQRAACLTHEQAHEAFIRYGDAMKKAAEVAGVPMEDLMEKLPNERRILFMGMTIGAMVAGATLEFEINPGMFGK